MNRKLKGPFNMLLAVSFFAIANTCVKLTAHLPVSQVILFRGLISLVICTVLIKAKGLSFRGNNPKILFLRGVFGTISLSLFFYTLQVMPLATAVSVQYMAPIFTVLFAGFLVNEKANRLVWLCFAIAVGGVLMAEGFDPNVMPFEAFLGLISAMSSGVAYNLIRMARTSDNELLVIFYFPLITIPIIGPFALWQWQPLTQMDWIWIMGVGVATHFGQIYMTKAFQAAPAREVSIWMYAGVVFAGAIGFFGFNERLTFMSHIGIGLIGLALILSTLIKQRDIPAAPKS